MNVLATLIDEVKRNEAAQAAMAVLQTVLERRTSEEQGAFWHAVGLYYVSRKAPGEVEADTDAPGPTLAEGGA